MLAVRVAVVGHVEWVLFAEVERVPAPGEIVHARTAWEDAAGGGAVAAAQLAALAGEVDFLCAVGDDELGARAVAGLRERGIRVHAALRPAPQRRAVTWLDARAERTITIVGERLVPRAEDDLPWSALADCDAVYLTAGDPGAVTAARAARVLVATPRAHDALGPAAVPLDALVLSAGDESERAWARGLAPPPAAVVETDGERGGRYRTPGGAEGRWVAARPPGPPVDAYGCGDSFAAGLTYGLGAGRSLDAALELAARCGAACLAGRGPYAGQLTRADAAP